MSDEYEYEDDERRPRRFTFGQIMLSLLLLGVVVVIGLIVLVYFTLTDNSHKTSTFSPQPVSAPVRPVERFTPDGKPIAANTQVTPQSPLAASEAAAQQKAADEAVNQLNNATATQINQAALAGGAAAGALAGQARQRPPKPRVRRQPINSETGETTPQTRRRATNQNNETGEVPLQPIQRGERRLTPNNRTQQGERQLTPRRSQQATDEQPKRPIRLAPQGEQRERPLTPTRPQGNNKSEAIDQLF